MMRKAPWITLRWERVPLSLRVDRRAPLVLALVGLLLLAVVIFSAGYGEYAVAPTDVLRAIVGIDTGDPQDALAVRAFRLPRIVLGVLVGAALGVSGGILQGITRNGLAGPGILGINAGAGLVAVLLLTTITSVSISVLPWAALVGALATALLIYLLAWRGGSHSVRLILVGIGLATLAVAATNYLIIRSDIYQAQQALIWLAGSLYGRDWGHVRVAAVWLLILLPASLLLARQLNPLALGDEVARGLGQRVELQRGLLLLISAVLAAASVAVAGTVGFVGFVAPHVARRLVGPSHEGLLPAAAAIGALLLATSDLLARAVIAPAELPVGVVTAVLGAPYFAALLLREARAGSGI